MRVASGFSRGKRKKNSRMKGGGEKSSYPIGALGAVFHISTSREVKNGENLG